MYMYMSRLACDDKDGNVVPDARIPLKCISSRQQKGIEVVEINASHSHIDKDGNVAPDARIVTPVLILSSILCSMKLSGKSKVSGKCQKKTSHGLGWDDD